ncbi:tyrosine-type recombinase/integrase [Metabacillus iocasae]|uniref:Integrase/recombinase XerD n=1 Tax=Priestia iocasae TaxID=2291674 RepID=A0ABS2QW73_9BACI|nr:tyrosine-type recombinase/integrase [Metabacillus iocasae]MBM7703725.1 integrase/recombinase XerD [Metabacillus iocasae]
MDLTQQSTFLKNTSTSFQQIKQEFQSRQFINEENDLDLTHATDEEFVELFFSLKVLRKSLSPHTIRSYNQDMRTILTFFYEQKIPLKEIGFMEVKLFNKVMTEKYANRSAARKLEFFKRLLEFGHQTHFYATLYTTWIEKPTIAKGHYSDKKEEQKNRTEFRELSEREAKVIVQGLERVVRSTKYQRQYQMRNRLIGQLLYLSGLRSSELLSLNWGSFREDRRGNVIADVIGKGKKERTIPIFQEVKESLMDYRQSFDESTTFHPFDTTPLFYRIKDYYRTGQKERLSYTTLYRAVKSAVYYVQANPSISPHWFRHSFITNSLANDVPLAVVKQVVGHSSIATTNVYLEKLQEESVYDAFKQSGYR